MVLLRWLLPAFLGSCLIAGVEITAARAAQESADGDEPIQLRRMIPSGEDVPSGRQVVLEFDRAVVPIGRMGRNDEELPFQLNPALECQWRWLNTSSLACQLGDGEATKLATHYKLERRAPDTRLEGQPLSLSDGHGFIVARPDVRWANFVTWLSPGYPVFRLVFNQEVTAESVAAHVYLRSQDEAHERTRLKVLADTTEQRRFQLVVSGDGKSRLRGARKVAPALTDVAPPTARTFLVTPHEELALDTRFELHTEPGLESSQGPMRGVKDRLIVQFDTFPSFRFLGVRCLSSTSDNWQFVAPATPMAEQSLCDPLHSVALEFSAPVPPEIVRDSVNISPDLAGGRTDYDPWANKIGRSRLNYAHLRGTTYPVWLPERLRARTAYSLDGLADAVRDSFDRPLPAHLEMAFGTDKRRSKLVLAHPYSVLEKHVDTEVPLYVTNLDHVNIKFRKLTSQASERAVSRRVDVPAVDDIAFALPLQVRDMLEGESGAVSGTIQGTPSSRVHENLYTFFSQVTPFQVHSKLGHFSSLVWVTDMRSGKPVPNAKVEIYANTYHNIDRSGEHPFGPFLTDANGLAKLPGLDSIDPDQKLINSWRADEPRWFLRIDAGEDLALLPLDHQFRAWNYGVATYNRPKFGHIRSWGTTAQGVYKTGDTIQFKLYVRAQNDAGLGPPPRSGYKLAVIDPRGKEIKTFENISLSEHGAFDAEVVVAQSAAVGWYDFVLSADYRRESWTPLRVLVSDFTPAPFKVSTHLNGDQFESGDEVVVTALGRLHSGGPYTHAETRVTARLKARHFAPTTPATKGFFFATNKDANREWQPLVESLVNLDSRGEASLRIPLTDTPVQYGTLQVESAVRDDRGKYISNQASARFVGLSRFVGLRTTQWLHDEDKPATLEYLVIDPDEQLVDDVAVSVDIEREETHAVRVKGAGNAYLTRYDKTWTSVARCHGTSALRAQNCTFTPREPGLYRATASIVDSKQRAHSTQHLLWVRGKGRVMWSQTNDFQLTIVAEENSHDVGDTARYLVRNPYPGATALITIERYGVIDSWLQNFDTATPVVEFEVTPDHVPGFYLSIVLVSPRVDSPLPQDGPDLAKPSFRMGYVRVPVEDPVKRLDVEVTADRDTYKPREQVEVTVQAKPRLGHHDEAIELAIAVLDEAVFDLIGQGLGYFDPYAGFYRLEALDVLNHNTLKRLVGRQKFEKKGANPGGDGGGGPGLRSLLKFVSYWNPALRTNQDGLANFSFTLPDNLTGWRIVVLAVTPSQRMGIGHTTVRVNQPIQLAPVMPNQVLEGDVFEAGFTVMNRTGAPRTLDVTLTASGAVGVTTTTETIEALPYERTTVWLPISDPEPGAIKFEALARDAQGGDRTQHSLTVHKRRSLETAASYGTTTDGQVIDQVLVPREIHDDVGSISTTLSTSVIGNVEGAFRYMRDYPYRCWEQILSKGVMASHYVSLADYLSGELPWEDAQSATLTALRDAAAFQAPNGGMTYWTPRNSRVSPYLSAYTAIAFNWLRNAGHEVPAEVEKRLHGYLQEMLRNNVMPSFFNRTMASSVRAVALAALAPHGKITLTDLARYQPHVEYMSLFGKSHFLSAALALESSVEQRLTVLETIEAHANVTGGKFQFTELLDDGYQQLLSTPLRSNCTILSSLVTYARSDEQRIGDTPFKLVRMITQARGNRDHWQNTQENVFCLNALIEYARQYEQVAPDMRVAVSLGTQPMGETRFTGLAQPLTTFAHPLTRSDLGKRFDVTIKRVGQGRLYYSTRLSYAPLAGHAHSVNAGIDVRREYSVQRDGAWHLLSTPFQVERGELVRVDLFLSLPAARHFVVVDDPIPGGLEPVNKDFANTSSIDAEAGEFQASGGSWWFNFDDWRGFGQSKWRFYHQELRHDAARFFSDYLPAGNYHLSYTAQAIAAGNFTIMPVHSEEMYDPDVFGKGVPDELEVER